MCSPGCRHGFLGHPLLDGIEQRVRILIRGYHNLQLVPHPLSARSEVEEMALDRITVSTSYFTSSGVAGIPPVAGFKQNGAQKIDFDPLAGYAIDFHPIAHAQT